MNTIEEGHLSAGPTIYVAEENAWLPTSFSDDPIAVLDGTGTVVASNDAFARLYGYGGVVELVGRAAASFLPREEYRRVYRLTAATFQNGAAVHCEPRIQTVRRDGSPFAVACRVELVAAAESPGGTAFRATIGPAEGETWPGPAKSAAEPHDARDGRQPGRDHDGAADRQRLAKALQQRTQELSALRTLSQGISFLLPFEEIVGLYLDRLVALARVKTAELFLARGSDLKLVRGSTAPRNAAALALNLGARERVAALALAEGAQVCPMSPPRRSRGEWIAAIPLSSAQDAFGVLVVTISGADQLSDRLPFLHMAAELISARLHNALLHRELQDRAAGLEEAVRQRTREVQTERDRTQAILETLGESVLVADPEGTVLFANPATSVLSGFARDEILGQPLWIGWSRQSLADAWPEAQRTLASGAPWQGEITGRRKNGVAYVAALTGTPLYATNNGDTPVSSVWVQRDITALREAERLKDQFVSCVSHELRTPISIIALTCDNLDRFRGQLDEAARWRMVDDIHEQAHLLARLAEDTLRISQIDAGRVPATRQLLDLARVAEDELAVQRPAAERRRQGLAVSNGTEVPVVGNETQLRQVIRNLVDNAIKFTPLGGEITCRCEMREGAAAEPPEAGGANTRTWAVVEVADTGIGIPQASLPHIFERFYRVDNESQVPGTGLGLTIARELVAQHGGWIDVASTVGAGSVFSIYLPAADSAPRARSALTAGGCL